MMSINLEHPWTLSLRLSLALLLCLVLGRSHAWAQQDSLRPLRPYQVEQSLADSIVRDARASFQALQAIPHYLDAITLAKGETPIPWLDIARFDSQIGQVLHGMKMHQQAETYAAKAVNDFKQAPTDRLTDRDRIAKIGYQLAAATEATALRKAAHAKAQLSAAIISATAIADSVPDALPTVWHKAAQIHLELGEWDQALSYAKQSANARLANAQKTRKPEAANPSQLVASLLTEAEIYLARGREIPYLSKPMGDSAAKCLERARPWLEKSSGRLGHQFGLDYAETLRLQYNFVQATPAYAMAVAAILSDSQADPHERGTLLEAQGRYLAEMKRYDDALEAYQLALQALIPGFQDSLVSHNPPTKLWGDEPKLFDLLNDKARAFAAQDRTDMALKCRSESFYFINHLRENLGSTSVYALSGPAVHAQYEEAIELAYGYAPPRRNSNNWEQVFEFMELSKTNDLLASLMEASQSGAFAISETKFLEWQGLQAEIADALRTGSNRLGKLRKRQAALKADLIARDPQFAKYTQALTIATIAEVQENLRDDEVFVEYFVGQKAVYLVAVSRNRQACHRVKITSAFGRWVESFVESVSIDPRTERGMQRYRGFEKPAYALFRTLLGPLVDTRFVPKIPHTLLIIPDGQLATIPFEALVTAPGSSFLTAPYLIRDCEVRYAHSATMLKAQATEFDRDTLASKGILAIAASPDSVAVIERLAKEADMAESALKGKHLRHSTFQLWADAPSKSNFRVLAGEFRFLHFASRTYLDTLNPLHSWIALDSAGATDTLFAYEVIRVPLHADLAILSACESATGHAISGEGMMSFVRAFSAAGCRRMIMSLWKVEDRSTMDIMETFYEQLKSGKPAAQSLRKARLDYLLESDNELRAHPYHWASLVTLGGNGPYMPQGPQQWSPWLIWGSITAFIVALIMRRRRDRQRKERRKLAGRQ